MKISLKWLSQYVDVKEFMVKPKELADILTQAGLEVENITNHAETFHHVVTGIILKKEVHPDADKLTLCQVSTGEGVVHQIVCGAKNHKENDRVVVALPGAVLPGNFAIKQSKIRGVESAGMLCSEKELGIAKESQGIMILPTEAPIGVEFAKYFGLEDVVFELKVTPNRADCLSHFGLAREISCLLDRSFEFPMKSFTPVSLSTQQKIKVTLKEPEMCPRYAGVYVSNLKVGPSPRWLTYALESIGLNSINNVVDVTNYVMMELGQPLHAFDAEEIKGLELIIEKAKAGEFFTTLDGTEMKLEGSELLIKDSSRAVALAGVVGGKNSGVSEKTKDIFIECAYFTPSTVRKTSRKHGVETDSAYRFSRGVDVDAILLALNRAACLIQEVAGGEIYSEPWDVYPHPHKKEAVLIDVGFVSQRLGYEVKSDDFQKWMKRLACKVEGGPQNFSVTPPSFRQDVVIDMDLVEEYARLNGYDKIPEATPVSAVTPSTHHQAYLQTRKLSELLRREGFQETNSLAFLGAKYQAATLGDLNKIKSCGLNVFEEPVKVLNPLNEDYDVMRTSVTPSLLKALSYNARHGNSFGRQFELGHIFYKNGEEYLQEARLGLLAWGQSHSLWQKESIPVVMQLKSHFENVLKMLGVSSYKWESNASSAPDFVHPNQFACLVFEGKKIGFIATLHPAIQEEMKLREEAAVGEFHFDSLMRGQPRVARTKHVSKFMMVERDLAFVCPKEMQAAQLVLEIEKAAGKHLMSVEVFDVFEGGSLSEGQKSIALRLIYQNTEATFSDEEIVALQKKVVDQVTQKLQVAVR